MDLNGSNAKVVVRVSFIILLQGEAHTTIAYSKCNIICSGKNQAFDVSAVLADGNAAAAEDDRRLLP
jgi:hypothetical protein